MLSSTHSAGGGGLNECDAVYAVLVALNFHVHQRAVS